MLTIEECIRLLISDFVSAFYLPEPMLSISPIPELIYHHNWIVIPSEVAGWCILKHRIIIQD
jgi:hypothetical protein